MPKIQVSTEVESSAYQLMEHLAKLIAAAKASGGFVLTAIPADISALVAELPGMIDNIKGSGADLIEDKLEFIKGVNLGAYDIMKAIEG